MERDTEVIILYSRGNVPFPLLREDVSDRMLTHLNLPNLDSEQFTYDDSVTVSD